MQTTNSKVSVIIPSYNRSRVIGRAVGSALAQTYQNIEVLVVDDASDDIDQLREVVAELGDERIRLICHDENRGGAAARNTGIDNAQGELLAFLDSDDEWLPSKLQEQMVLAEQQKGDDWLIYTRSRVLTTQPDGKEKCGIMPQKSIREGESVGDYLFVNSGWLPTPSMMLPRSLARRVPFNPDLRRHQDYDLLLRLEQEGCRFLMVEQPLVVVHWEDLHQTSRGLNPQRSLEFLKEYGGLMSARARSGFAYSQIVSRLLREGRRLEALGHGMRHVRPWHLSLASIVGACSMLIFRDARLAEWGAKLKKRIAK